MKNENVIESMVDKLGAILKIIDDYKRDAEVFKDLIKNYCNEHDVKKINGLVYNATYVEANRTTVDYKKLLEDMGVPSDVVAKYSKTTAVYSVKVNV
jgi:hypothetical protein